MDDGLILAGLLLALFVLPGAILLARAAVRRDPDVNGARVAFQLAFVFSFILLALFLSRACNSTRSEDYGALAALFLAVILVPVCFVVTLISAWLTVRHLQKDRGE